MLSITGETGSAPALTRIRLVLKALILFIQKEKKINLPLKKNGCSISFKVFYSSLQISLDGK